MDVDTSGKIELGELMTNMALQVAQLYFLLLLQGWGGLL
jgi:hypothetical protein